jgi:2-polyprenyl-3-methyl-5-hydroxy-6-metoxy-1,4-benzoquinol methylase
MTGIDKSALVRLFGFPATLVHGDPMVLDRWLWLKQRLPKARSGERLLDVGCGSGAFTIGAALRGYRALGLSWDVRNQQVARERAALCRADTASFEVLDVRKLDDRHDLQGAFDVAVCCENVEHIIDDRKLFRDMSACLKPGGRLLLTTPLLTYRPVSDTDNGPFVEVEDGGHVRRGYSAAMLAELCAEADLAVEKFTSCSGRVEAQASP